MRKPDRAIFAVAMIALGAASVATVSGTPWAAMAATAGLVAVADLLRLEISAGKLSSLAVAPAFGLALATGRPGAAILAFACGVLPIALIRREPGAIPSLSGHLLEIAAGAGVYRLAAGVDPAVISSADGEIRLSASAFLLAIGAMLAVDVGLRLARDPHGARPGTLAQALLPFHMAVGSAAGLFALAEPALGWSAYALFLAPLVATHHAFRQLTSVRRTFDQTIRALSTIPEVAGYSHAGHADRVAALAGALGRELGVADAELADLDVAARLHDLGRMRAATPDAVAGLEPSDLAASGATVVRRSGALPHVALIIELQHLPYRDDHGRVDETVPLGSRIVRVASAYDDLTGTGDGAHRDEEAVAIIARGSGTRYDPLVVAALTTVVAARVTA